MSVWFIVTCMEEMINRGSIFRRVGYARCRSTDKGGMCVWPFVYVCRSTKEVLVE